MLRERRLTGPCAFSVPRIPILYIRNILDDHRHENVQFSMFRFVLKLYFFLAVAVFNLQFAAEVPAGHEGPSKAREAKAARKRKEDAGNDANRLSNG